MAEETAPPKAAPRLLRIAYAVIQAVTLSVCYGLCWMTPSYENLFSQLEMRQLPLPTELFLAASRYVRTPLGSLSLAGFAVTLVALALKGWFDPFLKKLIVANVLGVALLIGFAYLSLRLPIVKIEEHLKDR